MNAGAGAAPGGGGGGPGSGSGGGGGGEGGGGHESEPDTGTEQGAEEPTAEGESERGEPQQEQQKKKRKRAPRPEKKPPPPEEPSGGGFGDDSAESRRKRDQEDHERQEKADARRERAFTAAGAAGGPAAEEGARLADAVKDKLIREPMRSAGLGFVVDAGPGAKLAMLAGALFALILFAAGGGAVYSQASACAPADDAIASQSTASLQGVPKKYVSFYIGAAEKFKLGERGPSIIAAIHKVESNFGTSTLPGVQSGSNSAGAKGPMQFLQSTWDTQGVDGDGDGDKDVYDPADAIYGTANYLHNSGAPGNWYDAIFAYNHADWYVTEVEDWASKFGKGSTTVEVSQTTQPSTIDSDASVSGISKAYSDFSVLVAQGTGLSLRVIGGWALAEGGPDDNPLNIGPGKSFGSIEAGAKATVALLKSSGYKGVMASVGTPDASQLDAIAASSWCPGCDGYRQLLQRTYESVEAHGDPGATAPSGEEGEGCTQADAPAGATGPAQLEKAVRLSEPQTYTNVLAKYMNAGRAPEPFDTRLMPDLIWILETYDLKVNAARESGHHTHGDGTAVDLAPYEDAASLSHWDETAKRLATDLGWNSGCAASGTAPVCPLKPAIQFVGYNGYDSAHGDPAHSATPHVHVSWQSDCYGCGGGALVDPRQWVMVFPAPGVDLGEPK